MLNGQDRVLEIYVFVFELDSLDGLFPPGIGSGTLLPAELTDLNQVVGEDGKDGYENDG